MRINNLRQHAFAVSFDSSKCKLAIPGNDSLLRYALEQAILDAAVQSIRQREIGDGLIQKISPHCVILGRIDGAFLLSVSEKRQQRTEAETACLARALTYRGLQLLERDAADIRTEPLFSNTHVVWSYQRYHVALLDRLKFAAALAEDHSLSVVDLEARARPNCDTLAAVSAMACAGLLQLSLHDFPIGPQTIVRMRRREQ